MKTTLTQQPFINQKLTHKTKAFCATIALALGATAMHVNAETVADPYNNARWQSPLAAEFSALDTTGNGLLLPNEASKGKAFTKTSFAKADVNKDGYIDQDEYIYYKTGAWPVVEKPNVDPNEDNLPDSAESMTNSEGDAMMTE